MEKSIRRDSMSDLAQASYFPESASVFQWRNVYVLWHVAGVIDFQSSLAPSSLLLSKSLYFSIQISLKMLAKQSKTNKNFSLL